MLRDRDSIRKPMATRETLIATWRFGRRVRTLVSGAFGLGAVLAASQVQADGKTAFLAEQLRKNADFRVRVDAALKLGTSDDADAVKPLCACLDEDEVEAVRISCAAALGKLKKPGGDACLKEHASDKSSKVREQVATSLKALGGGAATGGGGGPSCPNPPASGKAKYYVGVAVNNKTSRPDADIKPMVEQAVACKLQSLGRFKLAQDTDPKKMAAAASKDKLDGYFLNVIIEPFQYGGGNLKVSMKLTMMTHTRDLKGEIGKSLSMPGVSSPSKPDEDDLVKMAAEKITNDFAGLKP
jgi:hypothetical protein